MSFQHKTTTVLLFAALFMAIGWVAPMLFYTYAPQSHFIESGEFYAENVSNGGVEQTICFERTIREPTSGKVFIELYLVDENGEKIEVLTRNTERFFQPGERTIREEVQLPDSLSDGEYRYERVYRMQVYRGQLKRTFSFESEPFYIGSGSDDFDCHTERFK